MWVLVIVIGSFVIAFYWVAMNRIPARESLTYFEALTAREASR